MIKPRQYCRGNDVLQEALEDLNEDILEDSESVSSDVDDLG